MDQSPINPLMMGSPLPRTDQNLINQVKNTGGKPSGYWQSIILDVLSLLSALALGYTYFRYLVFGGPVWLVIALAFIFGACSVLQVFLAKNNGRRLFVMIGETILIVIWFIYFDQFQVVALAGGLTFLFLLWGYGSARLKANNDIEISFLSTSRRVLTKLTTAVLLSMILLYAPQAGSGRDFVSRESFTPFFDWAAGLANNFFPKLSLTDSYGSFAEGIARTQLENNPNYQALPAAQQQNAVAQAAGQFSDEIKTITGILPSAGSPLSDVAYDYIVSTLNGWKDKFQGQFVVAWVLVVFFTLRIVAAVFVWLAQFVSLVIYEILLAAQVIHITESTQTKENLAY